MDNPKHVGIVSYRTPDPGNTHDVKYSDDAWLAMRRTLAWFVLASGVFIGLCGCTVQPIVGSSGNFLANNAPNTFLFLVGSFYLGGTNWIVLGRALIIAGAAGIFLGPGWLLIRANTLARGSGLLAMIPLAMWVGPAVLFGLEDWHAESGLILLWISAPLVACAIVVHPSTRSMPKRGAPGLLGLLSLLPGLVGGIAGLFCGIFVTEMVDLISRNMLTVSHEDIFFGLAMYLTGVVTAIGGFVAGIVYGLRRSDAVLRPYEVMPGI